MISFLLFLFFISFFQFFNFTSIRNFLSNLKIPHISKRIPFTDSILEIFFDFLRFLALFLLTGFLVQGLQLVIFRFKKTPSQDRHHRRLQMIERARQMVTGNQDQSEVIRVLLDIIAGRKNSYWSIEEIDFGIPQWIQASEEEYEEQIFFTKDYIFHASKLIIYRSMLGWCWFIFHSVNLEE